MYVDETFDNAFLAYEPLRSHWLSVDHESSARLVEVEERIYASFPTLNSDNDNDDDEEDPLGYNLSRAFSRSKQLQRVSKFRGNYATRS